MSALVTHTLVVCVVAQSHLFSTMSAVTDAPHRLLLSHFTTWLRAKNREVDVPLLESLLDLRAMYDDLEPTLWPAGSVQDLLLRLLPAKGPTEPLPSDDGRRCPRCLFQVPTQHRPHVGSVRDTGGSHQGGSSQRQEDDCRSTGPYELVALKES